MESGDSGDSGDSGARKKRKQRQVGVISLGCPKNLVDTENMLGQFLQQGYALTPDPEQADLLVVNTCGFKADAEEESRQAILEMAEIKNRHPGKQLLVTGCLSQRYGADLASDIPDIDLLMGSAQYDRLIPLIESQPSTVPTSVATRIEITPPQLDFSEKKPFAKEPRLFTTPSHSAYVKIAEGCNNPCAFCIIPQLRGQFCSRRVEDIVAEVTELSQQGVVEINLVSQDSTLYGRDLTPRTSLAVLLQSLAAIEGITWIRTLYLYPTLLTEELLAVMAAEEKVLPYLDIPLQHSHSAVLTRMKRAEREADIQRLLESIETHLPNAVLRTTFIVGFPGETEAEFQHLYDFVGQGWFDHVGVFTYSDEQGTEAYHHPNKVPEAVAEQRREALMLLQQEISRETLSTYRGKSLPVLVDGVSEQSEWLLEGRTMGQAPEVDGVVYINEGSPQVGSIVEITITETHEYDLVGYSTEG